MRRWLSLLATAGLLGAAGVYAGCSVQCHYDTDCAGTQVCSKGSCVAPDLHKQVFGICQTDADCGVTETCIGGTCVAKGQPTDGGTPPTDGGTADGGAPADCPLVPSGASCTNWDSTQCPCLAGNYLLQPQCAGFSAAGVTGTQDGCQLNVAINDGNQSGNLSGSVDSNGTVQLAGFLDCTGSKDPTNEELDLLCGAGSAACHNFLIPFLGQEPGELIHTGDFLMGTGGLADGGVPDGGTAGDGGTPPADATPEHQVSVTCYEMDTNEVTWRYYYDCVAPPPNFTGTKCPLPPQFATAADLRNAPGSYLPVQGVSWKDAETYCEYVNGRLPTEAEWEKAARGGCEVRGKATCEAGVDDPDYPWAGDATNACTDDSFQTCSTTGPVKESDDPAGASVYGMVHMAGNVREWVFDAYSPTYYASSPATDPTGPPQTSTAERVIRGGAYDTDPLAGTVWRRDHALDSVPTGDPSIADVGFRCVHVK